MKKGKIKNLNVVGLLAAAALLATVATSCKDEPDNLSKGNWALLCEDTPLSYEGPVLFSEAIGQYVVRIDTLKVYRRGTVYSQRPGGIRPYVFVLPDGASDSCRNRRVAFMTYLIVKEQRWKDYKWKIYVSADTTYYYEPFSRTRDLRIIP